MVESIVSTLKLDLNLDDDRDVLISPKQLQRDLAFWIEGDVNGERRHSTIDHQSPIDDEQRTTVVRPLTPAQPRSLFTSLGEAQRAFPFICRSDTARPTQLEKNSSAELLRLPRQLNPWIFSMGKA